MEETANNNILVEINTDDIVNIEYIKNIIISLNESMIFVDKVTVNNEVVFTSDSGLIKDKEV